MRRPPLTIKQILAWADRHHELTGKWPENKSGRVRETFDEVWGNIDACLRLGFRGLPRTGTLAQLLAKHRGKRNRKALPKYSIRQILRWADAHFNRHGTWPTPDSSAIPGTNGETWCAVDIALSHGRRGLPGGSTLPKLLLEKRDAPHRLLVPRLTVSQILVWADAYYSREGVWPSSASGPVEPGSTDTWAKIDGALKQGARGLKGSQSLFKVLARYRGLTRHTRKRAVSVAEIGRWAKAYRREHGAWPTRDAGIIPGTRGETWYGIDLALRRGGRGLKGGSSLKEFLDGPR